MKPSDPEAHGPVVQLDRDFGALAIEVGSWTWSREGLTPRLCSLLCLAADLCTGTTGLPMEMHVHIALQNGATPQELHALTLTLAPWAGYPQCLVALAGIKKMLGNPDLRSEETPLDDAVEKTLAAYAPSDAEVGDFVIEQTRRIWRLAGLPAVERALLVTAGHVCLNTLGETFDLHVRLARAAGATDQQILSTIRFVAEFGWARSIAALEAVRTRRLLGP